jgi:hypothetical protein
MRADHIKIIALALIVFACETAPEPPMLQIESVTLTQRGDSVTVAFVASIAYDSATVEMHRAGDGLQRVATFPDTRTSIVVDWTPYVAGSATYTWVAVRLFVGNGASVIRSEQFTPKGRQ